MMQTSLFDIDNWREIGATLARNKTRTFLTAFGIFWGTMMLALLWGGADGLKGLMQRNFDGFTTNMGAFFPENTNISFAGFNKGRSWSMDTQDLENVRKLVEGIDASTGMIFSYGTATHGKNTASGQIMGIEADFARIQLPVVYSGRWINQSDVSAGRKVVVIGKEKANVLFPGEDPVGKYIDLGGVYFHIIGVAGQTGEASIGGRIDDSFYMPLSTMRGTFRPGRGIDALMITVKDGYKVAELTDPIRRVVYSAHYIHPSDKEALGVMDISELFEMVDNMFLGLTILALFVGFGSLMAGIIGVGNIMWIIVKERTHEIGIRRALGAKPSSIIMQILSESMVLTTIAGLGGITFASIVLALSDMLLTDELHGAPGFSLPFGNAVTILVLFMVLGTAAGIIPAVKAMRIKPIEALNDK